MRQIEPSGNSQSYIVRNPYSYCFRLNVPIDLQPLVGKRELRYSLRTGSVGIAKSKARLLAGQIQALFRLLRNGRALLLQNLNDERIRKVVQEYLDRYKKGLEDRNLSGQNPFMNEEDFHQYVEGLDTIKADKIAELGIGNYRHVEEIVDGILKGEGIEGIQKDSPDYIKLCRGVLRAQIKGIEYEKKFMLEELPEEPVPPKENPLPPPTPNPPPEKSPEEPWISLDQLVTDYMQDNLRADRWSPRTIKEYENCFRVLKDYFSPETPVNRIGYKEMQDYKKLLMKLPPNFYKAKQYQGMSLKEVAESEEKKGNLSGSAINRYLMTAQAVFGFGVRNHHVKFNPAEKLQLPKQKRPYEERAPFNKEDLFKLFCSAQYLNDGFVQPHMFWIPLLGLFTGCRIEELCQVHCSDVVTYDGIWCLDVNDDGEKRLKNRSSKRVVPLHPFLVDGLHFPDYAMKQKEVGHERIFHELKKISHSYSHSVSKWFNDRYKKQIGLVAKQGEKKSYHSFRHTFTDHLKQKMVSKEVLEELTGHVVEGEGLGRYGKPYVARVLYEQAILKLDYGIDLSHLKNSKWVVR